MSYCGCDPIDPDPTCRTHGINCVTYPPAPSVPDTTNHQEAPQ